MYRLVVDTGSSNTWVGASEGTRYSPTSTSRNTTNNFNITYGSGSVTGKEYVDQVSLGSLVIPGQSIGVANQSKGFDEFDGILGLGPAELTNGTLHPDDRAIVNTVVDNAFKSGLIPSDTFGIYIPHSDAPSPVTVGEISFGGADDSKYTGEITYVSITNTSTASKFWGINATFAYGTTLLGNRAGIVDTGTTLLLLADDWLQMIKEATGATTDGSSNLLCVSSSTVLQNLTITIGSQNFTLTPQQYTVPPGYYPDLGISSQPENAKKYLWFHSLGHDDDPGIDFILGLKFLEHYYSVYDIANRRVGLATAI
ncbi:hypothetical protein BGX21_005155 [Mortierella sp. AD011]|nr:hypothetical protein BGX20_009157 [Mortierella sp. AD010]KAF9400021.1 hypothetical protein BGX21_005155 [Mortierella sp. AD011]